MDTATPNVAIHCVAFNQENYIRQCLDGFVMQQTTFPFHAVVHDDASTDGTADIIRDYAQRYPDIIRPILETENQWSKHDGSLLRIMEAACGGSKYIAFCEGDDYWTDPLKLQKQVDFMEAHPDYSGCFHNVEVLDQRTGRILPVPDEDKIPEDTTIPDLIPYNYIHTASALYRQNPTVTRKLHRLANSIVLDYPRHVLYAEQGKIKHLSDKMAVYRLGVGIWNGANGSDFKNTIQSFMAQASLYSLLEDEAARKLLDKKLKGYLTKLNGLYDAQGQEIHRLQNTKAFRLGKSLLAPLHFLKKNNK
ncbi:MAG: glycosyltransferase [Bacteroidales bacterium]|nr:glycosyltransferase [Bacteroidales bacterium]